MVLQSLDEHAGNKERFSIATEKFKVPKNNVYAKGKKRRVIFKRAAELEAIAICGPKARRLMNKKG